MPMDPSAQRQNYLHLSDFKRSTSLPLRGKCEIKNELSHSPRRKPLLLGFIIVSSWVIFGSNPYLDYILRGNSLGESRNPAYLIRAKHGAVASENKRCSDIGVNILKDGGNAVDAAIGATFCTGVVNMFSWVAQSPLHCLPHRLTNPMQVWYWRWWLHDRTSTTFFSWSSL
jgi:gamma-glutamyltranspeptidase/glutathione hydrolase/leukotriene-C4 hydrolase